MAGAIEDQAPRANHFNNETIFQSIYVKSFNDFRCVRPIKKGLSCNVIQLRLTGTNINYY